MADITLHRETSVNRTVVPNSFIDAYMVRANGEYVKVYLYLLRCMNDPGMTFSTSDCADKFDHTEKDIIRALKYWEREHLIRLDYDEDGEICSIYLSDENTQTDAAPVREHQLIEDVEKALPKQSKFVCKDSTVFSQVTFIAESYLGRTLTFGEVDTLIFWVDTLGFDSDLIDYLIEICVSGGHSSFSYIDKVALSWAKKGIKTVDEARFENSQHSELYSQILKSFGISGRGISAAEDKYIFTWTTQYKMSTELIIEACNRTITTIHQPDFRYADSILDKWSKNGVKSIVDVKALDDVHNKTHNNIVPKRSSSAPKSNFNERDFDRSQLERELLKHANNQ